MLTILTEKLQKKLKLGKILANISNFFLFIYFYLARCVANNCGCAHSLVTSLLLFVVHDCIKPWRLGAERYSHVVLRIQLSQVCRSPHEKQMFNNF